MIKFKHNDDDNDNEEDSERLCYLLGYLLDEERSVVDVPRPTDWLAEVTHWTRIQAV